MVPVEDSMTTQWLRDRLLPVPYGGPVKVGALIPIGFDAYCRIFHPARRYVTEPGEHPPVRWSEIADSNGKVVHPLMHWHNILSHPEAPRFHHPEWGTAPCMGRLDPSEVEPIANVLARFTGTPSHCYFCLWEGSYQKERKSRPVEIGGYEYFVFEAGLDAVPVQDSPNLWWPADQAWCVATDIDSFYSLVGGCAECIASLLAHPGLETLPVKLDDRIDLGGDLVNT